MFNALKILPFIYDIQIYIKDISKLFQYSRCC
jgi:hypothetical protein